jgi:exosortase
MIGRLARSPWTRLVAGLAAMIALYAPILAELVRAWASAPSLSHGFVVPLISAYLVWGRRHDLAPMPIAPSLIGLPFLLSGLFLYVIGTLGGEPFVASWSFIVSLAGLILFLAGGAVMRTLLPAVGYLALMIPAPYVTLKGLTDWLRVIEATTAAWTLPPLGVPVFQDGFLLHLPNMTLEVAEVCSSVPAIISLLALGAALGYVTRRPPTVHIALILAAVPLGFLSNIARITLTAMGVHYVGPIVLQNALHTWHGAAVFVMTMGALSLLDTGLMRLRLDPR